MLACLLLYLSRNYLSQTRLFIYLRAFQVFLGNLFVCVLCTNSYFTDLLAVGFIDGKVQLMKISGKAEEDGKATLEVSDQTDRARSNVSRDWIVWHCVSIIAALRTRFHFEFLHQILEVKRLDNDRTWIAYASFHLRSSAILLYFWILAVINLLLSLAGIVSRRSRFARCSSRRRPMCCTPSPWTGAISPIGWLEALDKKAFKIYHA